MTLQVKIVADNKQMPQLGNLCYTASRTLWF